MWVVKLGGSLSDSAELPCWLEVLAQGKGRVVVVPGGGPFADRVRDADTRWRLPAAVSHHMALLAMSQYGLMLSGMNKELVPAACESEIRETRARARTPIWLPVPMALEDPSIEESWRVTSDSLAAWLAGRLGAHRLVLVKAARPTSREVGELIRSGVVDSMFGDYVSRAGCEVDCLGPEDYPLLAQSMNRQFGSAAAAASG